MRILSIDAGSISTGFGVIDADRGRLVLIEQGSINTSCRAEFAVPVTPRATPDFPTTAGAEIGKNAEAVEQLEAARALSGDTERTLSGLAYAYARAGDRANAETLLTRLREMSKGRYAPAFDIAEVYAALGEKDVAFSLLEKSFQDRHPWMVMLRVTPIFDPLRSDPRYAELVRRIVPR